MSRIAVVTGGTRGIGEAISKALKQDGYTVIATYAGNDDAAAKFKAETGVDVYKWDVSNYDACVAGVKQVEADLGPVEVLVNNAGITRDARIVKMEEEAFLAVMRVNLGAAYELTTAARDRFAEGASVISLASRAYLGNFGQFNYSASKGGLVGMTRALALELAPRVRVNAIAPSLTASEMTSAMPAKVLDKMIASIPLGRMAEPEEIAETIAALASPAMAYVTGQVVVACGGRSLAP
jgi:acetoacetyl-CoA reductase